MIRRPKVPAPDDPGIRPGGIRASERSAIEQPTSGDAARTIINIIIMTRATVATLIAGGITIAISLAEYWLF